MTLGERIAFYRKEHHFSQEALAEKVGVSRQAVSKWELDDALPELDRLVSLARVFSISTDELLDNVGEPQPKERPPGWDDTGRRLL